MGDYVQNAIVLSCPINLLTTASPVAFWGLEVGTTPAIHVTTVEKLLGKLDTIQLYLQSLALVFSFACK